MRGCLEKFVNPEVAGGNGGLRERRESNFVEKMEKQTTDLYTRCEQHTLGLASLQDIPKF